MFEAAHTAVAQACHITHYRAIALEVVPLATVGITGLATRATITADGCPAHPQGVRLRDGRMLPSYDWIAEPR